MNTSHLVIQNQKIKIVPSVEESLRAKGLNVDLDNNTSIWLDQLKSTWKTWKKNTALDSHVEIFFQTRSNDAYRIALVFIVKCEESKDCKPKSLPYYILEILRKWSQQSKIMPQEELKIHAFHIAIQQRSQHFLSLMTKVYQLASIKNVILPTVRGMIQNDNCKQASQVVIAMELFGDIPVEDLLFPLILQDKPNMIDEYLSECPNQVKPLLLFLDKLLDKNISIREYVEDYTEKNKICHIKSEKMHYRPLGKLVARLCNKFNIPIETCKNLSKNRTTGGLRYLIHQKYQEHNVSSSVWDDLVKDSLKQNEASAFEFIDMLLDYDRNEALKWALYLNIPEENLPFALRQLSLSDPQEEENWDTNVTAAEYYKFSLSENQIKMIDTGEKFYDLMSELTGSSIISLDCEWKPSFGATQSHVALIQVATYNKVYLIDTLILNKSEYSSFWFTFYKSYLDNAEIIKIGFGLEQDLKEMKASVTGLGNIKVKGEGLLDLCILWKTLLNNGLILPSNSDSGGNSLSSLVQSCFGQPLEKSEQCSNWELRPLRKTQTQYAALDAYVLIQIYDYLQKVCLQQNIKFEEICNDVMTEKKKKCTRKVKIIDRIQSSLPIPPRPVHEVKFLSEPQISYLVPYLRYCGIDTSIVDSSMVWCDVINLAISEDRLILLNKLKCSPSINYPQSSILDVGKGRITEQLRRILGNFHIAIKKEDLLTICIHCNGKSLTKMTSDDVVELNKNYQMKTKIDKTSHYRYVAEYHSTDDTGYENFLSDSDSDDDLPTSVSNITINQSNVTKSGIPIEMSNIHHLLESCKPAILCESCGKLFWEGHDEMKTVSKVVFNLTKFSFW